MIRAYGSDTIQGRSLSGPVEGIVKIYNLDLAFSNFVILTTGRLQRKNGVYGSAREISYLFYWKTFNCVQSVCVCFLFYNRSEKKIRIRGKPLHSKAREIIYSTYFQIYGKTSKGWDSNSSKQ